jgi:hypothetical protein
MNEQFHCGFKFEDLLRIRVDSFFNLPGGGNMLRLSPAPHKGNYP